MKTTGITRRIDDLGRVVLPIELRRMLGIEVKDSLEIFVDGDSVILRKYRRDTEKAEMVEQLENILSYSDHPEVCDIINEVREFIQKKA